MEKPKKLSRKVLKKANESARDQFAALGRFIQNFEFAVSVFRSDCAHLLMGGQRGISITQSSGVLTHWNMCSLVFHHEIMTARPLTEIWRALVIEQSKMLVSAKTLSENGMSVVEGVTTEVHNRFGELADRRNKLVHASWSIGRWMSEDDFTPLLVEKYTINKKGFTRRDDLPKTFDELIALGDEANQISGKLGRFIQFYRYQPSSIEQVFTKTDKTWSFVPPKPSREKLRKRSQSSPLHRPLLSDRPRNKRPPPP